MIESNHRDNVRGLADCKRGARTAIEMKINVCEQQKMLCSHFVFLKLGNSHCDVALNYSVSTIQSTNDNIRQFFFSSPTNKFHYFSKERISYGSKFEFSTISTT